MGYRTIIVLNNDDTNLWGDNPLGKAITSASGRKISNRGGEILLDGTQIGTIIDCEHADIESIVHFSSLSGTALAKDFYNPRVSEQELRENMLKEIASSMGYTLVKNNPEAKTPEVPHTPDCIFPLITKFDDLNEGQIDFADGIIKSAIIELYLDNGVHRDAVNRILENMGVANVFNEMGIDYKGGLIAIIEQENNVTLTGGSLLPKSLKGTEYVHLVEAIVDVMDWE